MLAAITETAERWLNSAREQERQAQEAKRTQEEMRRNEARVKDAIGNIGTEFNIASKINNYLRADRDYSGLDYCLGLRLDFTNVTPEQTKAMLKAAIDQGLIVPVEPAAVEAIGGTTHEPVLEAKFEE